MRRISKFLCAVFLLSPLAVSLLAADEGRIPIWEPVVLGPGDEGKYIVTRDISAAGPIIDVSVGTGEVDVDLNGFTLIGDPGGGTVVHADGARSVTLRNGTIQRLGGTGNGIEVRNTTHVIIEDVKVHLVGSTGGRGILLFHLSNFAVRRNIITGSHFQGILVNGPAPPARQVYGTVADNLIQDCESGISILNGTSVAVVNNRVDRTSGNLGFGNGIECNTCDGCLIAQNTIGGSSTEGIIVFDSTGNTIRDNVLNGNGTDGLALTGDSHDNLVVDNVSVGNTRDGLRVNGDRNHIEGNVLNNNDRGGLFFEASAEDNNYGRNTGRGNSISPGTCPAPSCTGLTAPDFCDDGTGNTSFGSNQIPGPPVC